ncbi:MAG: oligoendopeptidase, partial [Bacillota bacterium]|nr:oligoendopeptidase [Bacillota bacterium]
MAYPLQWNLETLFPGGSASPRLKETVEAVEADAKDLLAAWSREGGGGRDLGTKIQTLTDLNLRFSDAFAFVGCLLAAQVDDRQAALWQGKLQEIGALLSQLERLLDDRLGALSEEAFGELLKDPDLQAAAFNLKERRQRAKRHMDLPLELLAAELSPSGFHGWNRLHSLVAGRLRITYELEGKVQEVSAGQAESLLDHPRREVREALFKGWEEAWGKEADVLALALNNLAGFRRVLQRRRGYADPLDEPLELNRLQRKTLEAMWEAVDGARPRLKRYLEAKAGFLGVGELSWFDLSAPLFTDAPVLSYDQAAEIILTEFSRLDGELYAMAQRAFAEGWIEAEDRPGKAQGGFCTRFNAARQSRIFLTFGGTLPDAATIAHELG